MEAELFSWGRTDRQTDRHEEANSRFSQFLKSAWNCNFSLPTLMTAYGGVEAWLHSFLTGVDGGELSNSHPDLFITGKWLSYSLNRRLSGSRRLSEHLRAEIIFLNLPGFESIA
jgi:hypothetical protein